MSTLLAEQKSQIDKLWETFWSNGIANPLIVIEQISYLLFIKELDEKHTLEEKKALINGKRNRYSTLLRA